MSGLFVLGTALGAISGGKLVQKGRRRLVIIGSITGLVGTCLNFYINYYVFLVSRLIMGMSYGFSCIAIPRFTEEYVPPHLYSILSPVYIFSIQVGTISAVLSGLLLPPDKDKPDILRENQIYHYVFAFPLIPFSLCLLLMFLVIDTDSPKFYLV
jgi:MFS family permease